MEHYAGLDVSVKDTSVCIVDDTGKIVREVKVASEPEALLAVFKNPAYHFKRIGLEAGPLIGAGTQRSRSPASPEMPIVPTLPGAFAALDQRAENAILANAILQ